MSKDSTCCLGNLSPNPGSRKKRKVLGRGPGSGTGGTSGKGHKGQRSRSGGKRDASFEGGQMPIQRRVPKRGFTNNFRKIYQIINIEALSRFDGEVTTEVLLKSGMAKKGTLVKILGAGDLDKAITVHASVFSASAKAKIEKAGGRAVVI